MYISFEYRNMVLLILIPRALIPLPCDWRSFHHTNVNISFNLMTMFVLSPEDAYYDNYKVDECLMT